MGWVEGKVGGGAAPPPTTFQFWAFAIRVTSQPSLRVALLATWEKRRGRINGQAELRTLMDATADLFE